MAITLIRIFIDGPEVSLNGSPTVSPTTVPPCGCRTLAAVIAPFDVLLGVVPGAAGVGHGQRQQTQPSSDAAEHAAEGFRSRSRNPPPPARLIASIPGGTMRRIAASVAMSTQRSVSGSAFAFPQGPESL